MIGDILDNEDYVYLHGKFSTVGKRKVKSMLKKVGIRSTYIYTEYTTKIITENQVDELGYEWKDDVEIITVKDFLIHYKESNKNNLCDNTEQLKELLLSNNVDNVNLAINLIGSNIINDDLIPYLQLNKDVNGMRNFLKRRKIKCGFMDRAQNRMNKVIYYLGDYNTEEFIIDLFNYCNR